VSATTRTFNPVWLKDGKCPSDEYHFYGAAREIYSYLKLLAKKHGGFIFPGIKDIARHTKKWNKDRTPFSERQCKRIIRDFITLGILEKRVIRTPLNIPYSGWQFREHDSWAESGGGFCEFKDWEHLTLAQEDKKQNVPSDVPPDVFPNVPRNVPVMSHLMSP
jgi:hypothetical protein